MDSILVTSTITTMRITVVVNLPVILLAFAVGAAAIIPNPNLAYKLEPLVKGPSHFSHSFSLRLSPLVFCSTRRQGRISRQ